MSTRPQRLDMPRGRGFIARGMRIEFCVLICARDVEHGMIESARIDVELLARQIGYAGKQSALALGVEHGEPVLFFIFGNGCRDAHSFFEKIDYLAVGFVYLLS